MKNLYLILCFLTVSFVFFGPTGQGGKYILWEPSNPDLNFTPNDILKKLHENEIIRYPEAIRLIWRFTNGDKNLNVGPISLDGREWAWDVAKKLEEYRPYYKKVTVYEGESLVSSHKKICNLIFQNEEICKNKNMYDYKSNYIIANTYQIDLIQGFSPKERDQSLINLYRKRYLKIINPLLVFRDDFIDSKGFSESEARRIFTIASLIESETKVETEKDIIAGVIKNRSEKNMNFEIDATVLFCFELSLSDEFLEAEKPKRLFYRDLDINCEYNTYKNKGLPPGPISAPGFSSLNAAISPGKHRYYFYVLEKDGVNHYFSETYDEHLGYIKLLRGDFQDDS